jgi:hypothetical protein
MQRARRAQKKLVKEETWLLYVNWNTAMLEALRSIESKSKSTTAATYKTADAALPLYLRPEAMVEHTCIELFRDSGIIPPEQFSDEDSGEDEMYEKGSESDEGGREKEPQITEEKLLDIMKRHVVIPAQQKGTLDAYVEHDNHDWRVGVGSHFLWGSFQKTLIDIAVELTPLDELRAIKDEEEPAVRGRALSAAGGGRGKGGVKGAKGTKKKEEEVDGPAAKARDKLMIDVILPRNGIIGDRLDIRKHEHLHVFEDFTEEEIAEKMRGSHMQALLFSLSECLKEIFEMFAGPATAHEKRVLKRHAHRRDLNDKRQSLGFAGFIRFASVFKLTSKCETDLVEEDDDDQSEYGDDDDVFAQSGVYSYGQLGKVFMSAIKVKQVDVVGGLTFEEFWEVSSTSTSSIRSTSISSKAVLIVPASAECIACGFGSLLLTPLLFPSLQALCRMAVCENAPLAPLDSTMAKAEARGNNRMVRSYSTAHADSADTMLQFIMAMW